MNLNAFAAFAAYNQK